MNVLVVLLTSPLKQDILVPIVQIFAIANSLISLPAAWLLQRKALAQWRPAFVRNFVTLWLPIIIVLISLFGLERPSANTHENTYVVGQPFNTLVRLSVGLWSYGLLRFLQITYKVYTLERISFRLPPIARGDPFLEHAADPKYFGVPGMDEVIQTARRQNRRLLYPILLIADERARPWRFAQRFALKANLLDRGFIYFSFTRPGSYVVDQLQRLAPGFDPDSAGGLVVDCFTPLVRSLRESEKENTRAFLAYSSRLSRLAHPVIFVDPRNPSDLARAYAACVAFLFGRFNNGPRVIYEAFSDFLYLTDREIATQLFRYTTVWEEETGIESLYVMCPNTIDPTFEEHIRWFSNTTLTFLETSVETRAGFTLEVRGLFRETRSYRVYNIGAFYG